MHPAQCTLQRYDVVLLLTRNRQNVSKTVWAVSVYEWLSYAGAGRWSAHKHRTTSAAKSFCFLFSSFDMNNIKMQTRQYLQCIAVLLCHLSREKCVSNRSVVSLCIFCHSIVVCLLLFVSFVLCECQENYENAPFQNVILSI